MSGICGLFHTDGRPVGREVLARMSDAARHRGPDGINSWDDQNVGLVQLLMATTPESTEENKPLFHPPTNSCVVFDGRLDNRDELVRRLETGTNQTPGISDMELVLLAWLKWGVECPARLLGDFAFAIYDGRERRLFCARDIASVKPLYYSFGSNSFVFGSTIAQVLACPGVSSRPNEGMIAEMLSTNFTSRVETIYQDILRLPAGHYLLVDRDRCRLGSYWQIQAKSRIRYADFDDYATHFEEIFTESVRCRLRCKGTVGVTLSGGKDSPSVAGMAQSLLKEPDSDASLKSMSVTFPGRDCDESQLIGDVVSKWGLDAHYAPFESFPELPDWAAQAHLTGDLPEVPTLSWLSGARRPLVAAGMKVWLTGSACRWKKWRRIPCGMYSSISFCRGCWGNGDRSYSTPVWRGQGNRVGLSQGLCASPPARLRRAGASDARDRACGSNGRAVFRGWMRFWIHRLHGWNQAIHDNPVPS